MTSTSSSDWRPPRAKKRFGQHFLSDPNILRRIADAAEIQPDEAAVEIGPGRGSLTAELATRARRVVAVEIDRELIAPLRDRFAAVTNVAVVEADVLAHAPGELLRLGAAAPPYVVVANLPYNIAAPAIRRFLEGDVRPRRMVVMVQREMADAIVAKPGKMSLLSVATQVYGDARMIMRVLPGSFSPPPNVQSAVVRIDVSDRPRVDVPLDRFFEVVRAGFGNPRKKLRNSLSFGLYMKQERVEEMLRDAGIDPDLRPQMLTVAHWAAVTQAWTVRRA